RALHRSSTGRRTHDGRSAFKAPVQRKATVRQFICRSGPRGVEAKVHTPSLRNVDEAIRRRFILVPFIVTIPTGDRNTNLGEKLKTEWPAILRWMLDGHSEWKRIGLKVPEGIRKATEDYLADQDALGQWIADCVETNPDAFTLTRKLFKSWKAWCEERNLG